MKKSSLILMTFVPVIIGYIINLLIMVPVLGVAAFYILPLLTTAFWFCLGRQYARCWKPVPAVLIAHIVGICSLFIYIWQFLFETDETRNMVLAGFSQMFSASAPLYLIGRIAVLGSNDTGRAAMLIMQVIALVYMIIVFGIGIYSGKKKAVRSF